MIKEEETAESLWETGAQDAEKLTGSREWMCRRGNEAWGKRDRPDTEGIEDGRFRSQWRNLCFLIRAKDGIK